MYRNEKASVIKPRNKAMRRNFEMAGPSGQPGISEVLGSKLDPEIDRLKYFVQFLIAYRKTPRHNLKLGNDNSFSRPFRVFFCGEGPHSRCYGRTAALRLIVKPYDEDD
jgi:hypothetical protein